MVFDIDEMVDDKAHGEVAEGGREDEPARVFRELQCEHWFICATRLVKLDARGPFCRCCSI